VDSCANRVLRPTKVSDLRIEPKPFLGRPMANLGNKRLINARLGVQKSTVFDKLSEQQNC
jgi:hypothetical protein